MLLHKFDQFLQSLRSCNIEDIQTDATTLSAVTQNMEGFSRYIKGVVRVRNRSHIKTIIEEANRWLIPLHPYSRGNNWGYGSKLPATSECVLLDLSELNQIIKIDEDQGTATIEPGVTQLALANELSRRNSKYYLDVTGSGEETSILGNALERGIAYGSIRAQQVAGLEVILGNGLLFRTGFGDSPNPVLAGLYPYGLGPSLDGLFFQSNFAIVTEGVIQLALRPECLFAISLSVDDAKLAELIKRITTLKQFRYLDGIPHIADRERTCSTIVPLVSDHASISIQDAQLLTDSVIKSDWTLTASVSGNSKIVREKIRRIRRELSSLGRAMALPLEEVTWKAKARSWLFSFLLSKEQQLVLAASAKLRQFHEGIPSNAGIRFLLSDSNKTVDQSLEGFLLCTPLAPLSGKNAEILRRLTQECARKYNVRSAMTLNLITDRVLEAVISLHFMNDSPEEVRKAHKCLQQLMHEFQNLGFYSYRINIDQMQSRTDRSEPMREVIKNLKNILDPNGIIAPGRYE